MKDSNYNQIVMSKEFETLDQPLMVEIIRRRQQPHTRMLDPHPDPVISKCIPPGQKYSPTPTCWTPIPTPSSVSAYLLVRVQPHTHMSDPHPDPVISKCIPRHQKYSPTATCWTPIPTPSSVSAYLLVRSTAPHPHVGPPSRPRHQYVHTSSSELQPHTHMLDPHPDPVISKCIPRHQKYSPTPTCWTPIPTPSSVSAYLLVRSTAPHPHVGPPSRPRHQ